MIKKIKNKIMFWKQTKEERREEIRKNIEKRLEMSNKELWETLSNDQKKSAIEKYLSEQDLEKVGFYHVLESNRNILRSLFVLMLGIILGVFGNVVANIGIKYIPYNDTTPEWLIDLLIFAVFIGIIFFIINLIEKETAINLNEYKVLEYLIKKVEEDKE